MEEKKKIINRYSKQKLTKKIKSLSYANSKINVVLCLCVG